MSHPDRFTGASPAQSAAAEFIGITEARNMPLRVAAEHRSALRASALPAWPNRSFIPRSPHREGFRLRLDAATWTALQFVANVFCGV